MCSANPSAGMLGCVDNNNASKILACDQGRSPRESAPASRRSDAPPFPYNGSTEPAGTRADTVTVVPDCTACSVHVSHAWLTLPAPAHKRMLAIAPASRLAGDADVNTSGQRA